MSIWIDTREKPRAIRLIVEEFDRRGVEHIRRKLDFADYCNPDNPGIVIDRKQNLNEIAFNVIQGKARFVREIERCNRAGWHMIVLIEHSSQIKTLEDVIQWKNPRLKDSPLAVSGERLFKILKAMEEFYGIEFQFCGKRQTGKRILDLLGVR